MGSSLYKNKPEFKGHETVIGVCMQGYGLDSVTSDFL